MKMSERDIGLVASMLTDDPDLLVNEEAVVNEWGAAPLGSGPRGGAPSGAPGLGSGPGPAPSVGAPDLGRLFGVTDPRQLKDLQMEFDSFVKFQPRLAAQGQEAAAKAFVQYKKRGQMPNERDPAELDRGGIGYGEFRG